MEDQNPTSEVNAVADFATGGVDDAVKTRNSRSFVSTASESVYSQQMRKIIATAIIIIICMNIIF